MIPRKKYHQSELHTYLKCGKLWEFRYERKLKPFSRAALTVGTAVDRAATALMVEKVHGRDMAIEDVLEVTSSEFENAAQETEFSEEEPRSKMKDQAIQLTALYVMKVAPFIEPATVQEEFVIEMDSGYDLGGTIDLPDRQGFIRDTKTSARSSAGNYQIPRAFQPAMYDFAYRALRGSAPAGFIFDILKKPTVKIGPEYQRTEGQVTDRDHEWLFDSIDAVHKGIQAGVALPAPEGSWYCSENWCSFWKLCKGRK